jgi:hypothetical protein
MGGTRAGSQNFVKKHGNKVSLSSVGGHDVGETSRRRRGTNVWRKRGGNIFSTIWIEFEVNHGGTSCACVQQTRTRGLADSTVIGGNAVAGV